MSDEELPSNPTVEQVASWLQTSVWSIYKLKERGQIPYWRRGKRLQFSRQDLLEWRKRASSQESKR